MVGRLPKTSEITTIDADALRKMSLPELIDVMKTLGLPEQEVETIGTALTKIVGSAVAVE